MSDLMQQILMKTSTTIQTLREIGSVGSGSIEASVGRLSGQMGVLLLTLSEIVEAMTAQTDDAERKDGKWGSFEMGDPSSPLSPKLLGQALAQAILSMEESADGRTLDWREFRVWPEGGSVRMHVPWATSSVRDTP